MATYSISDLEKISGIKAHTIRIWEQRYGIINPKRTKTNIRYYEDEDLKLLLHIALLNEQGMRISQIARLSPQEIVRRVQDLGTGTAGQDVQQNALLLSMIELNEDAFNEIINANVQDTGFEKTMQEVIYPFLDRVSMLWLSGAIHPAQESFMSFLIRQKIIVAIDALPVKENPAGQTFIIYLPEGENQELTLLVLHYILKSRNHRVINLGNNMRLQDVKDAYSIQPADYIFTMISETHSKMPVTRYVERLSELFPDTGILLSGYQVVAQQVPSTGNVHVLASLGEALQFLDSLELQSA